jgi:hypothetical protein
MSIMSQDNMEHSENYIKSEARDLQNYCYVKDWNNAKRILQRTPETVNYGVLESGSTIVYLMCMNFDSYKEIAYDILDTPNINVDIPNKKNVTPLMCAIMGKRLGLARELLKRGANPNYRTDTTTVLHLACIHTSTKFIQMLINAGADVNCKNGDGFTAKEHLKRKLDIGPKFSEYKSEEEKQTMISRWKTNMEFLEN